MLGNYIKECRNKLNWSCSELARQCGHPVSSIHGIETGANQNPRFQIILDLSRALNVSLIDIQKAFEDKGEV